jgi:hypothetical protein
MHRDDVNVKPGVQEQAPKVCKSCKGSQSTECAFCHGTGVMQLGDTIYSSVTGFSACPACKGRVCISILKYYYTYLELSPLHFPARKYLPLFPQSHNKAISSQLLKKLGSDCAA